MERTSISGLFGVFLGIFLARYYFPDSGVIGPILGGVLGGGFGGAVMALLEWRTSIPKSKKYVIKESVKKEVAATSTAAVNKPIYFGFGGWLYIVTISQMYSIYVCLTSFGEYFSILKSEDIRSLSNVGYSDVSNLYYILAILGILFLVGIIVLLLLTWFFAIKLSRFYIKSSIALYAFNLIGTLIMYGFYAFLINYMNVHLKTNESVFPEGTSGQFLGTIVSSIIWIPYFYKSERVRNTFVK